MCEGMCKHSFVWVWVHTRHRAFVEVRASLGVGPCLPHFETDAAMESAVPALEHLPTFLSPFPTL